MSIIVGLLEQAGVSIHRGAGSEINICCPFCSERGETPDTRFRLGINTATGAAQDFNCSWKSRGLIYTARELARVLGVRLSMAEVFRARPEAPIKREKPIHETQLAVVGLPEEYEPFEGKLDEFGIQARGYLEKRGVSTLQLVKHRIGFAVFGTLAWRVLFPVLDHKNRVVGCVGRDFTGRQKPKYLNTQGIKLLWNAHREASTAIVVEGVLDALHVESALLQVRDTVAVARLGSTVTPLQLKQLSKYDKVIVIPDWDLAGVHGGAKTCQIFAEHRLSTYIAVPEAMTGEDPGDMEAGRILDVIGSAIPWSASAARRMRLAATRMAI